MPRHGRWCSRRSRAADRRADQGAGCGVMTAGAGVVGLGRRTDQGVVVAARTTGRADRDQDAMVGCGGRMQRLPGAGMAGRAIAGAGSADCRADQGAGCGVMTAGAGVVGVGRRTDQGVVVAARRSWSQPTVTRTPWSKVVVGCSASQVPVWQLVQSPDPVWPMAEPIRAPCRHRDSWCRRYGSRSQH